MAAARVCGNVAVMCRGGRVVVILGKKTTTTRSLVIKIIGEIEGLKLELEEGAFFKKFGLPFFILRWVVVETRVRGSSGSRFNCARSDLSVAVVVAAACQ